MKNTINLTLCPKVLDGDIPTFRHDTKEEAQAHAVVWMADIDLNDTVLVCFENYRELPIEELRNEQMSFMVSHDSDDLCYFIEEFLDNTIKPIDFAIFAFDNYQEAFNYCADLKEGF